MSQRLWDKGEALDKRIHSFTVRTDPVVDREIFEWDILASAAHAKGLARINLLSAAELKKALEALKDLYPRARARELTIPPELEDCHTTLETLLNERLGEIGKKIHTGRSRNDQVLTAMRLYLKHSVLQVLEQLADLSKTIASSAATGRAVPMPGYTHLQPAMPSSVEFWFRAYHEHVLDLIRGGLHLSARIDSSPLGVGSGFSVPLPLDRSYTAQVLGFARVQRNAIRVQNSRGAEDLCVLRWFEEIGGVIEKIAVDLMLYTMAEFSFFTLPASMTTGSSIMPQKRNPDVIELLRASPSIVRGAARELESIIEKLPSSYHRDFQLTKEPVIRATGIISESVSILDAVLKGLEINPPKLTAAMHPELYATYALYRKVRDGKPFREAYRETADELKGDLEFLRAFAQDFSHIQQQLDQEAVQAAADMDSLGNEVTGRVSQFRDTLGRIFQTE